MYYDYIAFCLCNMMAVEIIFICIGNASNKINIMWECDNNWMNDSSNRYAMIVLIPILDQLKQLSIQ